FVPFFEETLATIPEGDVKDVKFPDGSVVRFKGVGRDYDPTNKEAAMKAIHESYEKKEILTGILYLEPRKPDFLTLLDATDAPLAHLSIEKLRPTREALEGIMESFR